MTLFAFLAAAAATTATPAAANPPAEFEAADMMLNLEDCLKEAKSNEPAYAECYKEAVSASEFLMEQYETALGEALSSDEKLQQAFLADQQNWKNYRVSSCSLYKVNKNAPINEINAMAAMCDFDVVEMRRNQLYGLASYLTVAEVKGELPQ